MNEEVKNENYNTKGKLNTMSKQRVKCILETVTIEPLLVLYEITTKLAEPAIKTMELEKSCKVSNLFNNTICELVLKSTIQNIEDQNFQVQESISTMNLWLAPITTIVPLLMVLFLGSYSDKHNIRKPFLLIPIIGEILSIIGCLICAVFMTQTNLQTLGVMKQVVPSLFGGNTVLLMAIYSYIVDVSSVKMRTIRVGVVRLLMHFSNIVTRAVSGILFQHVGYYGILATVLVSAILGLIYGLFCVVEPKRSKNSKSERGNIHDVFNLNHAVDTFSILIKEKRGNNLRSIQIIISSLFIYHGAINGKFIANLIYL